MTQSIDINVFHPDLLSFPNSTDFSFVVHVRKDITIMLTSTDLQQYQASARPLRLQSKFTANWKYQHHDKALNMRIKFVISAVNMHDDYIASDTEISR